MFKSDEDSRKNKRLLRRVDGLHNEQTACFDTEDSPNGTFSVPSIVYCSKESWF